MAELLFTPSKISLLVNQTKSFAISLSKPIHDVINVQLQVKNPSKFSLSESSFTFFPTDYVSRRLDIKGLGPGTTTIYATASPKIVSTLHAVLSAYVQQSTLLSKISYAFGWIYFISWAISGYPQVFKNYFRKSVVGLSFDFVMLNFIGFVLYSIFNIGLYMSPAFQEEYLEANPGSLIPVEPADIFYSVHGAVIALLTVFQCCIYERHKQRVSYLGLCLVAVYAAILAVGAGFCSYEKLSWLDLLHISFYMKLSITLVKYIPQAYMNYERKSTDGWSIGNIMLDFLGGVLSMGQMIINGYNYDDWTSLYGSPTKLGLAFFAVAFDIFFMMQHYIFYRKQPVKGYDLAS